MEKSKLLDRCGAEGEDRLLLAKVLDRAAQAEERNIRFRHTSEGQ